ncbi:copper-binding protein [Burkholderia ubonensis]|uniref:cupredoxin domain-containing protein n=1 Tax=Burkholderia ubonensis TaxID=101571 RepID=UPI00075C356B|nr:cupredoxin family copper-binding protein [Burkholderia ubonensis]KVO18201.1 copper-binding protein [Burkholderia ubonensis]
MAARNDAPTAPSRRGIGARFALAAALLCALFAASAASADSHVVVIEQMRFTPATLTVHSGDEVTWVNRDLFPHTASADGHGFDSGSIAPQASWRYVARERGRLPYSCTFHPTMHGTLIVR